MRILHAILFLYLILCFFWHWTHLRLPTIRIIIYSCLFSPMVIILTKTSVFKCYLWIFKVQYHAYLERCYDAIAIHFLYSHNLLKMKIIIMSHNFWTAIAIQCSIFHRLMAANLSVWRLRLGSWRLNNNALNFLKHV